MQNLLVQESVRPRGATDVPLAVDLDGTLIRSDLVWEALAQLLRTAPWQLLLCVLWMLKGKAHFKQQLASRVTLNVETLPWNTQVIDYLRVEFSQGRALYLVTGANERWAEAVADYLGLFRSVFASNAKQNNTRDQKQRCCVLAFGERGYDYLGDSGADLPAMRSGRKALVAGGGRTLLNRLRNHGVQVAAIFSAPSLSVSAVVRALRLHQWAKNALLFVPAFVGLQWSNPLALSAAARGALAFGLAASAFYLINDLLDLSSDRSHPSKRKRPFASGELPIWCGFLLPPLLLASAGAVASTLPVRFELLLAFYVVSTCLYSFRLKRVLMADVTMLAGMYTLRILAGGAASEIYLTPWLLLFSICIFSSLAFLKRYVEFASVETAEGSGKARAYEAEDSFLLAAMGVSSGMLSVLVLALYISSDDVTALYNHPTRLLPACPLLMFWINRLWLQARRKKTGDDPVLHVITDPMSYAVFASLAIAMFLAHMN